MLNTVLITLEGGLVTSITTDNEELARDLNFYIIDYDTDGADEEEVSRVTFNGGTAAEAIVRREDAGMTDIDVDKLIEELNRGT